MRISDWSSDVCSSDLVVLAVRLVDRRLRAEEGPQVADVVVPHGGIGGVRKRRIAGRTVGRPALAQRLADIGLRPGSAAMFPVRQTLGAVTVTERRSAGPSTGPPRPPTRVILMA